jgi:hypothetical protein
MSSSINKRIIEKLPGNCYKSEPVVNINSPCDRIITKSHINKILNIKNGMKVMFVINDIGENRRWANGTLGTIVGIQLNNNVIDSVTVNINRDNKVTSYEVKKIQHIILGIIGDKIINIGYVENFPFIPAYATTIDKVQGMTLEKAAIVLEKITRPNQIYVGLSRVTKLENLLILERELACRDIKRSKNIDKFLSSIESKICDVYYRPKDGIKNNMQLFINGDRNIVNVMQINPTVLAELKEYKSINIYPYLQAAGL